MAQKYIVQLVDDLTREDIEAGTGESVRFGLDGVGYTIDLTAEHAGNLREALAPYLAVARKADSVVRAPRGTAGSRAARTPKGDLKAIRDWANANGHPVSGRGRIPGVVQDAYNAAN